MSNYPYSLAQWLPEAIPKEDTADSLIERLKRRRELLLSYVANRPKTDAELAQIGRLLAALEEKA